MTRLTFDHLTDAAEALEYGDPFHVCTFCGVSASGDIPDCPRGAAVCDVTAFDELALIDALKRDLPAIETELYRQGNKPGSPDFNTIHEVEELIRSNR